MGDSKRSSTCSSSTCSIPPSPPPPPSPSPSPSLVKPSPPKKHKVTGPLRIFRSVLRSLQIMSPVCRFSSLPGGRLPGDGRISSGSKQTVTGTLFGYRKGRVSLAIQENPRTIPTLVIELAIQTCVLRQEINLGMVRIALECEKSCDGGNTNLLDEPMWTMFWNGKKNGYGVKREETEEDLYLMEVLRADSMGAGVIPGRSRPPGENQGPDGEIAYMRANFERLVGSKDCETYYMLSPDGNSSPELSVFFVRL